MSDKFFIDTNILIYALDQHSPQKQAQARELLRAANSQEKLALSTQVLQEFFVASTRKLYLEPMTAKQILRGFSHFETVLITTSQIDQAIDDSIQYTLSFWDALIVTAADHIHCSELWTEDLNDGQKVRGVTIVNPFEHFQDVMAKFS